MGLPVYASLSSSSMFFLFCWCTSTHIRDVGTFNGHQHQLTRMIQSEMATFVAQNTVESRERPASCRSRDWQQQQSPKCIWEQNDRSPSNLQINTHSLWSSCEDVPCAMLLKSGLRFFVETSCKLQLLTSSHKHISKLLTTFLMNWFAAYFQFPLSPSVICTQHLSSLTELLQHLFQQLLNWSLDALDALTSAIIPTDVEIFAFFVWKALLRLADGWTMCWSMQIKCKVCTFCYSTNRPQDSNKHRKGPQHLCNRF